MCYKMISDCVTRNLHKALLLGMELLMLVTLKNTLVPELLGRLEVGALQQGQKTNELIEKHVHTRGFVHTCVT